MWFLEELKRNKVPRVKGLHRSNMRREFDTAIHQVENLLSRAQNAEERTAILNFAIKAVKRDLIGEGLVQLVYGRAAPDWRSEFPLPSQEEKKMISIDLGKTDVLTIPWHTERLSQAILDLLHTPFDQNKDYYTATYYPEIDLVIVGNGIHHTAVASIGNGGIVDRCRVIHLAPAFDELSTDGAVWKNAKYGSILPVSDFRFALLYALAKMQSIYAPNILTKGI